jgi:hypothetical protein
MTRDQMTTTLALMGWQPAAYGKAWIGIYQEGVGLLYVRTDSNIPSNPNWAAGWTVKDVVGGGSDILDATWPKIPYDLLKSLFKWIERHGK